MKTNSQGPKIKKKKSPPPPKEGVCALLKVNGKFAKSHLIPKALTAPDVPGERFIEAGQGNRPIRRFSSWYDHELVVTEGEKILGEIDDAGIAELRANRLIWSGWQGKKKLHVRDFVMSPDPGTGIGFRQFKNYDATKLRLFFLSVLWRSLATKIKEFEYLDNLGIDLDYLGDQIVKKNPGAFDYLPIMISQMSTVGFSHNHSPTIQEIKHEDGKVYRFYRLYMQGVIAHIYTGDCKDLCISCGGLFLGGREDFGVITHKFENSRQFEEAKYTIQQASNEWPNFKT